MPSEKPRRPVRTYISWALFAVSAALFVIVALLWYQDRENQNALPTPPSRPGRNEAINVLNALREQDLKADFDRTGGGRAQVLSVAGQAIKIGDAELYVFIYPQGVESRELDIEDLDFAEISVVDTAGTPVADGTPNVFTGSNVVAVLYGGSSDTATKVKQAIEGLP